MLALGLLPVSVKMPANGRCWHCGSIACGCEDVSKWVMPSQGLLPVGVKMPANGRCWHCGAVACGCEDVSKWAMLAL